MEADAYDRRRLVIALVSGAPDGPEVEPARPGRTLLGGVALAVLLVAGAAVAGMLTGREPVGWDRPGLLVAEETGGLFVILEEGDEPEVHAIANVTSARLLLGPDVEPTVLAQETIAARARGEDLGIPGAPPTVPDPDRLVGSGWTACTSRAGGLAVSLSGASGARPVVEGGFTVVSEGRHHVVATGRAQPGAPRRAYRYALPDGVEPDPLLAALGLPIADDAREVPARWLRLLPAGGVLGLRTLRLDRYGEPAPDRGTGGLPRDARIGQVVTGDGATFQVLTAAGPAALDPFAKAVHEASVRPGHGDPALVEPMVLDAPPRVDGARPPFAGAHWPDALLDAEPGDPCLVLDAAPDAPPVTLLATAPPGAAPGRSEERITMPPGHGALVEVVGRDATAGGPSYLVDSRGAAHPLEGSAAERLGYASVRPALVPAPWVELLAPGVPLSTARARSPAPASPVPWQTHAR